MTTKIALVVPALAESGGVRSVAEFIQRTVKTRSDFELQLISLSMSASDTCSTSVLSPLSWGKEIQTTSGILNGVPFIHLGAELGEIETQRLKPREKLASLLTD